MVLEGGGDPLCLDAAAVDAGVHALVAAGHHPRALALGDRGGEGALPLSPRPRPQPPGPLLHRRVRSYAF